MAMKFGRLLGDVAWWKEEEVQFWSVDAIADGLLMSDFVTRICVFRWIYVIRETFFAREDILQENFSNV